MAESRSQSQDTDEAPGAVSSQNQEEAEAGHAADDERPDGQAPDSAEQGAGGGEAESPDSAPGAASEGSQATGHPDNAG
ncbi:MAG TPA: hypothetical protein VIJ20_00445 [Solirubrobacteraceae bacterium]